MSMQLCSQPRDSPNTRRMHKRHTGARSKPSFPPPDQRGRSRRVSAAPPAPWLRAGPALHATCSPPSHNPVPAHRLPHSRHLEAASAREGNQWDKMEAFSTTQAEVSQSNTHSRRTHGGKPDSVSQSASTTCRAPGLHLQPLRQ